MTTTTEHSTTLVLPVVLDKLAESLSKLRYDALRAFVDGLADAIHVDAMSDEVRGRVKLAERLERASQLIGQAADELEVAWKICRPHMEGT